MSIFGVALSDGTNSASSIQQHNEENQIGQEKLMKAAIGRIYDEGAILELRDVACSERSSEENQCGRSTADPSSMNKEKYIKTITDSLSQINNPKEKSALETIIIDLEELLKNIKIKSARDVIYDDDWKPHIITIELNKDQKIDLYSLANEFFCDRVGEYHYQKEKAFVNEYSSAELKKSLIRHGYFITKSTPFELPTEANKDELIKTNTERGRLNITQLPEGREEEDLRIEDEDTNDVQGEAKEITEEDIIEKSEDDQGTEVKEEDIEENSENNQPPEVEEEDDEGDKQEKNQASESTGKGNYRLQPPGDVTWKEASSLPYRKELGELFKKGVIVQIGEETINPKEESEKEYRKKIEKCIRRQGNLRLQYALKRLIHRVADAAGDEELKMDYSKPINFSLLAENLTVDEDKYPGVYNTKNIATIPYKSIKEELINMGVLEQKETSNEESENTGSGEALGGDTVEISSQGGTGGTRGISGTDERNVELENAKKDTGESKKEKALDESLTQFYQDELIVYFVHKGDILPSELDRKGYIKNIKDALGEIEDLQHKEKIKTIIINVNKIFQDIANNPDLERNREKDRIPFGYLASILETDSEDNLKEYLISENFIVKKTNGEKGMIPSEETQITAEEKENLKLQESIPPENDEENKLDPNSITRRMNDSDKSVEDKIKDLQEIIDSTEADFQAKQAALLMLGRFVGDVDVKNYLAKFIAENQRKILTDDETSWYVRTAIGSLRRIDPNTALTIVIKDSDGTDIDLSATKNQRHSATKPPVDEKEAAKFWRIDRIRDILNADQKSINGLYESIEKTLNLFKPSPDSTNESDKEKKQGSSDEKNLKVKVHLTSPRFSSLA